MGLRVTVISDNNVTIAPHQHGAHSLWNAAVSAHTTHMRNFPEPLRKPRRLRFGSRIALIAPAGPIDDERLQNAVRCCELLGLEAVIGKSAAQRGGYLAGTDEMRAADLQTAIDDPGIDGIWALRGGYGTVRLLQHVSLDAMCATPKPYIGFSDNTSIHLALARLGVVSFHGPHAGGDFPPFTRQSFHDVMFGEAVRELSTPEHAPLESWRGGNAEGRLVGGNLALLAAAEGTPFSLPSDNAILFIEDIAEPPYRIDRLLMQLALSGALDGVTGMIIGQFTDCDDVSARALDVVRTAALALNVPVLANAPIGHTENNWTVPVGIRARIDADRCTITLLEPVVFDER